MPRIIHTEPSLCCGVMSFRTNQGSCIGIQGMASLKTSAGNAVLAVLCRNQAAGLAIRDLLNDGRPSAVVNNMNGQPMLLVTLTEGRGQTAPAGQSTARRP